LPAPHLSHEDARELLTRAHERCPYSNATRLSELTRAAGQLEEQKIVRVVSVDVE
jgi:hypothetical protein